MTDSQRLAICPGTFDPIHNGHLDIIERAARVFGRVLVLVARNPQKHTLFSAEERAELVRASCGHLSNVTVEIFSGLLTDCARERGAAVIVKGMRTADDFQVEQQMAMMNRALLPEVETMLLMTSPEAIYLSSTLIKEVHSFGGDVSRFVPPPVAAALAEKTG